MSVSILIVHKIVVGCGFVQMFSATFTRLEPLECQRQFPSVTASEYPLIGRDKSVSFVICFWLCMCLVRTAFLAFDESDLCLKCTKIDRASTCHGLGSVVCTVNLAFFDGRVLCRLNFHVVLSLSL